MVGLRESLHGTLEQFSGSFAVAVGEEVVGIVNPNLRILRKLLDYDFEEITRFLLQN